MIMDWREARAAMLRIGVMLVVAIVVVVGLVLSHH